MDRRGKLLACTGVCLILSLLAWPGTANATIVFDEIQINGVVVS